jgi:hypothetical protein
VLVPSSSSSLMVTLASRTVADPGAHVPLGVARVLAQAWPPCEYDSHVHRRCWTGPCSRDASSPRYSTRPSSTPIPSTTHGVPHVVANSIVKHVCCAQCSRLTSPASRTEKADDAPYDAQGTRTHERSMRRMRLDRALSSSSHNR